MAYRATTSSSGSSSYYAGVIQELKNKKSNYVKLQKDLVDIDNNDKKDDAQRRMTWTALIGMLMYPVLVIIADMFGIPHASDLISGMSAVYLASVSAIIMVFFGANAYIRSRKKIKDKQCNPPQDKQV